ncbi:TauD/TfdA family dioxygenase [Nocardiopsis sp. CNR-923]|uniref:TauD/TfdA family dioxygenase n=1 Tax=Nocardiopsis sp. CNR-923 TaxID=1904965 RepID=UPI001300D1F2|nr:TauD/TfdA family dioxygenase [Nocardiopsis sp. CNR-923]
MPESVSGELLTLARASVARADRWEPLAPPPEVSPKVRALLARVRDALAREPEFVLLRGFPMDEEPEVVETAYWLLGTLIGQPVSQTRDGTFLTRVEDRGADIASPIQRGHRSASALAFHADRTDVIGLLCVRPAEEGGQSQIVSSKALHNIVLEEAPELLPVLYGTFPNDQRGEEQPGLPGWCPLPVFSHTEGDFAARYVRRFIEDSQRHPDAPRLTAQQRGAMDILDEILHRPGVALQMDLRPGDLQLINNFQLLHSRSAFRDPVGEGRGRLLLRLWLSFEASPHLPPTYGEIYGETSRGAYRGGVWPPGVRIHREEQEVHGE